jgi:transcriptional regulator with GAF, ATPase, and Fis domain
VAQAVWKLDAKRRERPFVAVNCGSVGGELAESEFFGHERGAFTGADQPRAGLFRAAQGGVLFLDEVGELSEVHQAKLLRVLQEGRVRGIGADREVPVDVRVLAATNRDLTERVRQGQFRQDLYQRLHVLHIHLPPLRERPEDIDPLIHRFVSQVGGDPPGVTPEFVHALKQANLPGNVRELENLVRQAIFLRDGDGPLGLADLPRELLSGLALPESTSGTVSSESPLASVGLPDAEALLAEHNWNLARAVSHCEKLLLAAALERTRGNQSEAARLLGITARSVYNKLRRHRRSR